MQLARPRTPVGAKKCLSSGQNQAIFASDGRQLVESRMKSIAVILAKNTQNCGMYSVDLAALHFFQKIGVPVDLFCAIPPAGLNGDFNIQFLQRLEQLDSYDVVVYWGDFTTNPMYGMKDFLFQDMHFRGSANTQESWSRWCSIFLPPIIDNNKIYLSIGQNFQAIRSVLDRLSVSNLNERYNRFHHIFVRDSYSHSELIDIFPDMIGKVSCGMDCAFLVNQVVAGVGERKTDTFCSSFGRSKFSNYSILTDLLKSGGQKQVVISDWLKLREYRPHWQYRQNLDHLRSANFVLSDTYHFIINSIREGTPVIGFGQKNSAPINTLSDFKKDVLFKDLQILDYYFHLDDGKISDDSLTKIFDMVSNPNFHSDWRKKRNKISDDISNFEQSLQKIFIEVLF